MERDVGGAWGSMLGQAGAGDLLHPLFLHGSKQAPLSAWHLDHLTLEELRFSNRAPPSGLCSAALGQEPPATCLMLQPFVLEV